MTRLQEGEHGGDGEAAAEQEEGPREGVHRRAVHGTVHRPVNQRHQGLAHAEQRVHFA